MSSWSASVVIGSSSPARISVGTPDPVEFGEPVVGADFVAEEVESDFLAHDDARD